MDRLRFDTVKLVTSSEHLSSINSALFRQCLANIAYLGICKLDIDGIVEDCYFNKLHITKDIDLQVTPEILDRLNQCTGVDHHLQQRRGDWIIQKQGIPR